MSTLLVAAARLERVLLAENAALQAIKLDALPALFQEKTAAAADLAVAVAKPVARTPALKAQAERLRDLAAENHRLLARAIDVQDRVLRLVAGAARQAGLHQAARYGAAGRPRPDRTAMALQTRA
ncbi:MAG: hypothetical protein ACRYHQ_32825 [Janthinobacterium lividum]